MSEWVRRGTAKLENLLGADDGKVLHEGGIEADESGPGKLVGTAVGESADIDRYRVLARRAGNGTSGIANALIVGPVVDGGLPITLGCCARLLSPDCFDVNSNFSQ